MGWGPWRGGKAKDIRAGIEYFLKVDIVAIVIWSCLMGLWCGLPVHWWERVDPQVPEDTIQLTQLLVVLSVSE